LGALVVQRRFAQVVPQLGTEEEMQKQAIEQIRARVLYQKELVAAKKAAHGHEDVAEMWRWVNITFLVGVPISVLSILYSYLFDEHAHRAEGELPEYMSVRSKEYPWKCSECDLFNLECWKKCKAAKS
jgi:cytochrome c oxidase subunit 6a